MCVCVSLASMWMESSRSWCWWKAPRPLPWQWVTRDKRCAICCVSDSDMLTWPTGQAWLSALAYLSGTALVTSHPATWSPTFAWNHWDRGSSVLGALQCAHELGQITLKHRLLLNTNYMPGCVISNVTFGSRKMQSDLNIFRLLLIYSNSETVPPYTYQNACNFSLFFHFATYHVR